jgi:hypothetical protein
VKYDEEGPFILYAACLIQKGPKPRLRINKHEVWHDMV